MDVLSRMAKRLPTPNLADEGLRSFFMADSMRAGSAAHASLFAGLRASPARRPQPGLARGIGPSRRRPCQDSTLFARKATSVQTVQPRTTPNRQNSPQAVAVSRKPQERARRRAEHPGTASPGCLRPPRVSRERDASRTEWPSSARRGHGPGSHPNERRRAAPVSAYHQGIALPTFPILGSVEAKGHAKSGRTHLIDRPWSVVHSPLHEV